jgi:hypothetical protein
MHLLIHNRSLLRGMVAGAVALASATACSHKDRADAGRDTTQTGTAVVPADTVSATSNAPVTDTASNTAATTTQAPTPRIHPDSSMQKSDKGVAGYRGMERDTSVPSANGATDSAGHIRPTADSSVSAASNSDSAATASSVNVAMGTAAAVSAAAVSSDSVTSATQSDSMSTEVSASADSSAEGHAHPGAVVAGAAVVGGVAAAGNDGGQANQTEASPDANAEREAPIARDTSSELAQADSMQQAQADSGAVLAQADTTTQVPSDSTPDGHAGAAVGAAAIAGAVAADREPSERVHPDTVSQKADELAKHEPARVRPPEDSTETLGHVTTDGPANADLAAVGAAGVASTGNIATGAEAVGQMSRGGEHCTVTVPEKSRDIQWDMASSPATLNPCGTGTMTLPRIWTGEKR